MEDASNADLNLEFEEGIFSLWEILTSFPLPVVVQCDTCVSPIPVDRSRFNFDLQQPLLLFRKRNIQKVLGRSIHIDPETRCYQEIGEPLLIPEDYKGWFSVLRRNYTGGPVDDLVPHFQTVSEIVETNTETFLIGGERKVQALQISHDEDGTLSHQERTLFPGDVLRKGKIYVGQKKKKSKYLRKVKIVTEKYLLCTDESDREVLLPFDQKGLFYTLTANSGNLNRPVMQMSEIVARKSPPCVVRLVYGRVPNTPCSFTGTLRLDRADLENSVIAATMVNTRNILLEIPTSCDLKFKVAITSNELVDHSTYRNALDLCNEKAIIYMRNMKVCHTIESDSHFEFKEDTTTSNNLDVKTSSPNLKASVSSSNSTSSNEVASHGDRGSDYFEMRNLLDPFPEKSIEPEPPPCPNSHGSYIKMDNSVEQAVLNIFLENSYLAVPVIANGNNEGQDADLQEPADSKQPPPPPACLGTPPKPCLGSYDSGIQMENETSMRRPSTITFVDGKRYYEENITYDIPRLPSRRVSAPAGCSLVNSSVDTETKEAQETKQNFARRASTIPNSSVRNTLSKGVQRNADNIMERRTDASQASRLSDEVIPEFDSDEEYGNPVYQNIKGLKEIEQELLSHSREMERLSNEADLLKPPSPCTSNRSSLSLKDSGRSSPSGEYNSRSSNKYSGRSGRISPAYFSSLPIGPIPELPKSRSSSPYQTKIYENDSESEKSFSNESNLVIPELPTPCTSRPLPCVGTVTKTADRGNIDSDDYTAMAEFSGDYMEMNDRINDTPEMEEVRSGKQAVYLNESNDDQLHELYVESTSPENESYEEPPLLNYNSNHNFSGDPRDTFDQVNSEGQSDTDNPVHDKTCLAEESGKFNKNQISSDECEGGKSHVIAPVENVIEVKNIDGIIQDTETGVTHGVDQDTQEKNAAICDVYQDTQENSAAIHAVYQDMQENSAANSGAIHGVYQDTQENSAAIHGVYQDTQENSAAIHGAYQDTQENSAAIHGVYQDTQENSAAIHGAYQDTQENSAADSAAIHGVYQDTQENSATTDVEPPDHVDSSILNADERSNSKDVGSSENDYSLAQGNPSHSEDPHAASDTVGSYGVAELVLRSEDMTCDPHRGEPVEMSSSETESVSQSVRNEHLPELPVKDVPSNDFVSQRESGSVGGDCPSPIVFDSNVQSSGVTVEPENETDTTHSYIDSTEIIPHDKVPTVNENEENDDKHNEGGDDNEQISVVQHDFNEEEATFKSTPMEIFERDEMCSEHRSDSDMAITPGTTENSDDDFSALSTNIDDFNQTVTLNDIPSVTLSSVKEVTESGSDISSQATDDESPQLSDTSRTTINSPVRMRHVARRKKSRDSIDISKLTVDDLAVQFKRVGIKDQTIDLLKSKNLNGPKLLEKYSEFETIREFLPTAGLIDQQKISLFIQGCKY